MQKRAHWFEISLALAVLVTHGYAAFAPKPSLLMWFRNDDAFFYFKVAQNIAAGLGSTFDGISLANGYHPLWMLVCIPVFALAKIDLYLPLRVLVFVLAALNIGAGLFIFRLMGRLVRQPIAMLAAAFWVFYPGIHAQTTQGGLETGINVFFLAWLVYALGELSDSEPPSLRQMAKLGTLASLAVLSRLDNIFVLLILGVWGVWRTEKFRSQVIGYILLTVLGVLFSFIARSGMAGFYAFSVPAMFTIGISLLVHIPVYYFSGVFNLDYRQPRKSILTMLLASGLSSGAMVILLVAASLTGVVGRFPYLMPLYDFFFGLAGIGVVTGFNHWFSDAGEGGKTAPWLYFKANWLKWLKRAILYFGILGGTIGVYMGINYFLFGTPMPVSGQIKQWWGTIYSIYGRPPDQLIAFLGFNSTGDVIPFPLLYNLMRLFLLPKAIPFLGLLAAYSLVGLGLLAKRDTGFRSRLDRSPWFALMVGALVHIWSYNIRGYVAMREWYWAAQMLATVIGMGLFWDALLAKLPLKALNGTSAVLGLSTLAVFVISLGSLVPYDTSLLREDLTADVYFLEENTEPGSLIGMAGGGMPGYLISGRTIINLDGLINSVEYFKLLRQYKSYEYYDRIGLDYVFGSDYIVTESDPYGKVFANRLALVKPFQSSLRLFKYQPAP